MLSKIIKEEVFQLPLKNVEFAGNGEVFLSEIYNDLIMNDDKQYVDVLCIQSNGTLFSMEKFEKYCKVPKEIVICISVDAATKETYQSLRRGGNWDVLIENLKQIAELRRRNVITYYALAYVIQQENVHEMSKFVEMAKNLSADCVYFSGIRNFGNIGKEEWREVAIVDSEGKLLPEFQEYFTDELIHDEIVDFSNMCEAINKDCTPKYLYDTYPVIFYEEE